MTRRDPFVRVTIVLAFLTLLTLVEPMCRGLAACWTGESDFCAHPLPGD